MTEVAIIDCGIGNLFSIECALKKIGLDTSIASSKKRLQSLDAIVLPGVGNFKAGAQNLEFLRSDLIRLVEDEVPLLGICLGMQLLFQESQEGSGRGLGLLEGKVVRLPDKVKTPHMGWNTLRISKSIEILDGIGEEDHFYFVHSYFGKPKRRDIIIAETDYGASFASVVAKENVFGTQFHPEKSGQPGEQILRNFARIIKK